jgi:type I restriction enzyme S subunit
VVALQKRPVNLSIGGANDHVFLRCYPVLNGSNLSGFVLSEDSFNYVTPQKAASLNKAVASRGDVVITHRGTLGQIVYIPENSKYERYVISQSQFRVRCNSGNMLPEFMVYYFHSREGQHQLLSNSSQVGVPALARPSSTFQKLEIPVPPIEEQQKIVGVLTSLDARIAINRMINHHLEQMAQTLFHHWFVESENAKKWEDRPLYEYAQFINGAAYRDFDFSLDRSGLPIIKIAEIKNGITDQTKFTNKQMEEKYRIIDGDILFAWSGSPDTSIDTFIWSNGEGWLNQHIFKVNSPSQEQKWFTYLLLKHFKEIFIEIARDKQTTGLGHVTVKDLNRLTFPCPPEQVIVQFDEIVGPMLDLISANEIESRRLASQRDVLLPKLLSGEVSVADI